VAGASEGLGAAFATELSRRGLRLVLAARRPGPLAELAATLPGDPVTVAADLATTEGLDVVTQATADKEIGLVVCNAAYSPIGPFLDLDETHAQQAVAVNCVAPLTLAQRFLPAMKQRGRGGFIIMSSLSGLQGTPPISVYAATKAFGAVLAEGLWAELKGTGVNVQACVAGPIRTPGFAESTLEAPGTLEAGVVARAALKGLGHGPRTVPGALPKVSHALMGRLLPRRAAIAIVSRASRGLAPRV
jgi:short-subunit dehydrogenase